MKYLLYSFIFLNFLAFGQELEINHSIHQAFIENKGQWDNKVLFKGKFQGGNLWIQQHKFVFHLMDFSTLHEAHANPSYKGSNLKSKNNSQDVIHLNFIGSNEVHQIEKLKPIEPYYNFFLGNNKRKWASNVRAFSETKLKEIYDGIDLKVLEENSSYKYEFIVKPGVSTSKILLNYEGQQRLSIDKRGNLHILSKVGTIQEQKPYAYQVINGKVFEIPCEFILEGKNVSFNIGNYNSKFELIIDPILVFATYSGSLTDNFGMTATYAHNGDAYSGGTIYGNQYPTPDQNAYDITSNFTVNSGNYGITDVFISKYSSDGSKMLWTTFIGGGDNTQGTETVHSLIADKNDNLFLFGATSSSDFPVVNGFQTSHGGGENGYNFTNNGVFFKENGTDIYVAKFSSNGQNLLASTYIGGNSNDGVNVSQVDVYDSITPNYGDNFRGEIMLDHKENVIVASCTRSLNFPVKNAFQSTIGGKQDGVVFQLSNNLSNLLWSSYFGGSQNDACYSVKIDSSKNIVFAGGTTSTNLPKTIGSWKTSYNGGKVDGFVTKLTSDGKSIIRTSYIGTANDDQAFFVEIDRNDNIFLMGQSVGGGFPIINANYSNPNSAQFILKLDKDLAKALNSTVFGNGNSKINISPSAFLVDVCGNIYVSGWGANILQPTRLNNMPVSPDAFQSSSGDGYNFYLFVLERNFNSLKYATYLGGNQAHEHVDGGTSRFDKNGVVYQSVCGGCGGHSDFPTTPNAWSNQNRSQNCNNVVFKFDFELKLQSDFTVDKFEGCAPLKVNFNNTSLPSSTYLWNFGNGQSSSSIYSPSVVYTQPGEYTAFLLVKDSICLITDTSKIKITVSQAFKHMRSNDTILCKSQQIKLFASSFGIAEKIIWSSNRNFTDTLNVPLTDSIISVTPLNATQYYYVKFINGNCMVNDSVKVELLQEQLELSSINNCEEGYYTIEASINSKVASTTEWNPKGIITKEISKSKIQISPTKDTTVYFNISYANNCNLKDSIKILYSPLSKKNVLAAANDSVIAPNTSIILNATPQGNYNYQWTPVDGLSSPTQSTTNATVKETTTYTVSVSDGICSVSDDVTIYCYSNLCKPPEVFVPNAFSPNDKGKNEILFVRGPQITKMLFRVYNRWGELVFESKDPNIGWDGTFKGKKVDPDVFDYYLEVTCIGNNTEIIKGNITVLK